MESTTTCHSIILKMKDVMILLEKHTLELTWGGEWPARCHQSNTI